MMLWPFRAAVLARDRCATRPCGYRNGREAPGRRGSDQATFPAREPPDALLPCHAAGCHALRRGRCRSEPARAGGHGGGPGGATWPRRPGRAWARTAGRRWSRRVRGRSAAGMRWSSSSRWRWRRRWSAGTGGCRLPGTRLITPGSGVAEDRLDALAGQADVIGQIAAGVTLRGKVKGAARRAMTPALTIRFTLLMTLMPSDADYAEVLAALMGDLARCRGSGRTRCRPRRWPAPGGRRSGPGRWSSCGTWCWPASTPSTATMTTGRSWWVTWTPARSTGR